jgi:hypothetical protein
MFWTLNPLLSPCGPERLDPAEGRIVLAFLKATKSCGAEAVPKRLDIMHEIDQIPRATQVVHRFRKQTCSVKRIC